MKKVIITMSAAILFLGLVSFQLNTVIGSTDPMQVIPDGNDLLLTEDVQTVLDKSCLQCHGVDGSGKAKFKWNFAKMEEMKVSKLNSKMNKLIKEVENEKMPTKKYLKKHPEAALLDEDKQILIDWANSVKESIKE